MCWSTPAATTRISAAVRSRARSHPAYAAQPGTRPPLPCHGRQALSHARAGDDCVIHMRAELSTDRALQPREGATVVIVTG